jgi:hypothetical protein
MTVPLIFWGFMAKGLKKGIDLQVLIPMGV